MYMCVRGIDFVFISMIFLFDFGTVVMVLNKVFQDECIFHELCSTMQHVRDQFRKVRHSALRYNWTC